MKKTILLFFVVSFFSALSLCTNAQYSTVNVTASFNADVVADSIGSPTISTTSDVDGVGYVFVAPNYQYNSSCALPTLSLPAGGLFTSQTTPGLSFQLAPYDNMNDLRLKGTSSGTLNFSTGVTAQTVYLLGTSGSGSSQINATVNFSDGTSQAFTGISISDWFTGTTNIAIQGFSRVSKTVGACGGLAAQTTTPILYQLPLVLNSTNYAETITSVTVTAANAGNSVVNIMGVSVEAPPTACTGTPNVGGTLISATNVCSGAFITLSLQNPLTNTSGLTYQWQSSPDSLNWANLAGEDSITCTTSAVALTYYRCVVTCTNSGLSTTSPAVSVNLNPTYLCPCGPATGVTLHSGTEPIILSTNITGTSLFINTPTSPSDGSGYIYNNAPNTVPTLTQGLTYTLNITLDFNGIAAAWFDWNHNGVFDANEYNSINVGGGTTGTLIFTVPDTALLGNMLMRIRDRETFFSMGATDPCTNFFDGETQDYLINIVAPDSCSSPNSIITSVSPVYACALGTQESLTVSSYAGGNLSTSDVWQYQWTDTAGNVVQPWSTSPTYNVTPTQTGNITYKVYMKPSHCASAVNVIAGSGSFSQGYWGTVTSTAANCNSKGSLTVQTSFGQDSVWYANNFASDSLDPNYVTLYDNASITGGRAVITPSATGNKGGLAILNPNGIDNPTSAYTIDFDMTSDEPINIYGTGGGDGLAYSFGDDAFYSNITGPNAYGAGTKLRVIFHAVTNANVYQRGTYLVYGYQGSDPNGLTPTTAGVLAYSTDMSWKFATDKHVRIVINNSGQLTLTVGSNVIFNNVQLPADYLSEDKSIWQHLFSANTGGDALRQAITNLSIKTQIYLYSLSNNGTSWQASSTFDSLPAGSYPVYVSDIYGICSGLLGTYQVIDSCGLPVKLVSFKGELINNGTTASLKWAMAEIEKGLQFEVQRSTDGRTFGTVGNVNAVDGQYNYGYLDENLASGHYYYRLKMVASDGSFTYSNIVLITTDKGEIVAKVYPNPLNASSVLAIACYNNQTLQLVLTDLLGRKIMNKTVNLQAGANNLPLGDIDLAKGTYILQVAPQMGNPVTIKVIK